MRIDVEMHPARRAAGVAGNAVLSLLLVVLLLAGTGWCARATASDVEEALAAAAVVPGLPVSSVTFDARRDPAADLKLALAAAQQHQRRVLASVNADVLIADARYQTALIRKFAQHWK
jgi:hypothetical protein